MVDKSPDAFRTISEVAEDLDLPQHVLRFWETRFPQIKPLKRGGGRRYYRPDDVALITGLKTLLYGQGYTIKGVQRILKEQGAKTVQAVGRGGVLSMAAPAMMPAGAQMPAIAASADGAEVREASPQQGAAQDLANGHEPRAAALTVGEHQASAQHGPQTQSGGRFSAANASPAPGGIAADGADGAQAAAPALDPDMEQVLRMALAELQHARKELARALARPSDG